MGCMGRSWTRQGWSALVSCWRGGGETSGRGGFCLPKCSNATSAKHTLRSIAAFPLLPCWSVCCLHARLLACTCTTFDYSVNTVQRLELLLPCLPSLLLIFEPSRLLSPPCPCCCRGPRHRARPSHSGGAGLRWQCAPAQDQKHPDCHGGSRGQAAHRRSREFNGEGGGEEGREGKREGRSI